MPTRIVREGILTSLAVNKLSDKAELFYRRLMSVADDYGRFFANTAILRAHCYPLKIDSVSEADVKRFLSECMESKDDDGIPLVSIYGTGKFILIHKFKQQTRGRSKFPEPDENELLIKCKSDVKQMLSQTDPAPTTTTPSTTTPTTSSPESFSTKNGFIKPTMEQVKFCMEKAGVPASEASRFLNYYESNGWKVGKNPMKSWQHAVGNWAANYRERGQIQKPKQPILRDMIPEEDYQ